MLYRKIQHGKNFPIVYDNYFLCYSILQFHFVLSVHVFSVFYGLFRLNFIEVSHINVPLSYNNLLG